MLIGKGMMKMCKNKHLTLQERLTIESELWRRSSFKKIALLLEKDCTTISKEVRKHIEIKETGSRGKSVNNCINRDTCLKKESVLNIVFKLKINIVSIVKCVIKIVMNLLKKNV